MWGSQSQAMRVCCCQTVAGMCFRRMRVSPEASRCSHCEAWDATSTTWGQAQRHGSDLGCESLKEGIAAQARAGAATGKDGLHCAPAEAGHVATAGVWSGLVVEEGGGEQCRCSYCQALGHLQPEYQVHMT